MAVLLVLSGSLALLYFLLLVSYRAFRGRGRKEDGGLLPPWGLKIVASMFGVIAILIIFFGYDENKIMPVLGGIGYLIISFSVLALSKNRL
jgi:hypothetical protein